MIFFSLFGQIRMHREHQSSKVSIIPGTFCCSPTFCDSFRIFMKIGSKILSLVSICTACQEYKTLSQTKCNSSYLILHTCFLPLVGEFCSISFALLFKLCLNLDLLLMIAMIEGIHYLCIFDSPPPALLTNFWANFSFPWICMFFATCQQKFSIIFPNFHI